jgi:NADH-quinone oxidoreductase subunit H
VSMIRALRVQNPQGTPRVLLLIGLLAVVGFVLWAFLASTKREDEAAAARRAVVPPEIDPFEGGYPVPPMPGQTVRRTTGPVLAARAAAVGGGSTTTTTTTSMTTSTDDDDEEVHGG